MQSIGKISANERHLSQPEQEWPAIPASRRHKHFPYLSKAAVMASTNSTGKSFAETSSFCITAAGQFKCLHPNLGDLAIPRTGPTTEGGEEGAERNFLEPPTGNSKFTLIWCTSLAADGRLRVGPPWSLGVRNPYEIPAGIFVLWGIVRKGFCNIHRLHL
jgi:hypothetical protein